jgi:Tol biopolymer transport system component
MSNATALQEKTVLPTVRLERGRTLSLLALLAGLVAVMSLGTTAAFAALPDNRAYEMVSPPDKSGAVVKFETAGGGVADTALSTDGDRALFLSYGAFAGATGAVFNGYQADRSASGEWTSKAISPTPDPNGTLVSDQTAPLDASDDLLTTVFFTSQSLNPFDSDGVGPGAAVDLYTRSPQGTLDWTSRSNSDVVDSDPSSASYTGRSGDGKHVVFETADPLTQPQSGPPLAPGTSNLYDRYEGHTYLVNVDSSGAQIGSNGAVAAGGSSGTGSTFPSISADGSEIAFIEAPGSSTCGLYLRVHDAETLVVSGSQRTIADPTSACPVYQGISPDGSRVFFSSSVMLTDEATSSGGLYEYDVESGALHLRVASTGAFPPTNTPTVSVDGSRVYFKSTDQLTIDAPVASQSTYLLDNGTVRYVNSVSPFYVGVMSKDGGTYAFPSADKLTAFDNHASVELYVYRAGQTGPVTCISCRPDGGTPTGDATFTTAGNSTAPRNVSADGRRIFFQTPDALTPDDHNDALDVYEYEDGAAHLISPGLGGGPAFFASASESGHDVMFSTTLGLVPEDTDGGTDLYDARVDGRRAPPVALPTECTGDTCQGALSPAPLLPTAASMTFGPGNLAASPATPTKRPARPTVTSPKTITGPAANVRIKVPVAGRLTTYGSGLKRTQRSLRRAGTYTVKVTLSERAQTRLKSHHPVTATVRVSFTPKRGKASTVRARLTFKPSSSKATRKARRSTSAHRQARS